MKGRNEIRLCEAAMIEAMQAWLDETMPAFGTVAGVKMVTEAHSPTFIVSTEELGPEAPR